MHSVIGGSKAPIFVHCAQFVDMTSGLPDEEPSQESREGTASHEIGAELITSAAVGRFLTWADFEGRTAADGTPYDEDMFEGAKLYADDVGSVMRSTGVFVPKVEELLLAKRIHASAFGTPDTALYHAAGGKLYLWDYKYGRRYVDAFENWQAVYYFAALLDAYGIDGLADQFLELEFRIVQPRAYGVGGSVRSWTLRASDLRPFVNQLAAAAEAQFRADSVATSGPHCRDCLAFKLARCPVGLRGGMSLLEVAERTSPTEMDPASLGFQLSIIRRGMERLEQLETAFSAQVEAHVKGGKSVPGWTREPTYGRATWNTTVENAIAVGASLGVDISKPGVKTPTQAKAAGLPADVVDALTIRPKRGHKVVEDDGSQARRIFTNN